MEEELGITGYIPEFVTKDFKDSGTGDNLRRFSSHYKVTMPHDYPFVIKEDEVAEIRWFTPKELTEAIEGTPEIFVPTFRLYYKNFLTR
jgi:isopentenyldiphosphate isomerase